MVIMMNNYEKYVKDFVYEVINNSEDDEISISFDSLLELYRKSKLSNFKFTSDVIESDVINFEPFVTIRECFYVDEKYSICFDVVYAESGITSISGYIFDRSINDVVVYICVH